MNNKNLHSATIHGLSHEGRGITTHEQKTTFIAEALPGEEIEYQITQKRGSYNEGKLTQVLSASAQRTRPACEHFGVCGGCNLQHMAQDLQIEFKTQAFLDQLRHFGHVIPETHLAPLTAETLGYRRKARLGVKFVIKKDKILIGFRERSSRYLADLAGCEILHPAIGKNFPLLRALIAELDSYQHIPQIEIAIGDTDIALVFRHMQDLTQADIDKLVQFSQRTGMQVYLQPNPPAKVTKLWPNDGNERLSYTLPEQQIEFLFHPLDFTQINLTINRLMVNQALQLLDLQAHERVLDLFCGIGNFSLPLAQAAAYVTGIEGSEIMVNRAYENAQHNHINNVEFFAANLMAENIAAPWLEQTYDKILLDPPRAGAKELIPLLPKLQARRIVYVSCNPATLARDAGELAKLGYKLTAAGIMNMFPHTAHIEAMAVFDKE